ncbi:hypothetical protein [Staphylococcus haemolyticus]|uniref:hypothetical protein n=1 Tax=Staphylococcus haemolyticus TaxID=1283 RepID=UPI001F462ED9|nr:hypothetical protein [Staphylococcus haemolyticus]
MTLPSLSKSSTFVFGSVVTSTGSVVPALPSKLPTTDGFVGGVVSSCLHWIRC